VVRKTISALANGAPIFCGSFADELIPCLITVNFCARILLKEVCGCCYPWLTLNKGHHDENERSEFRQNEQGGFREVNSKLLNSLMLAALTVPGMAMAADAETTEHKEGIHVIPHPRILLPQTWPVQRLPVPRYFSNGRQAGDSGRFRLCARQWILCRGLGFKHQLLTDSTAVTGATSSQLETGYLFRVQEWLC